MVVEWCTISVANSFEVAWRRRKEGGREEEEEKSQKISKKLKRKESERRAMWKKAVQPEESYKPLSCARLLLRMRLRGAESFASDQCLMKGGKGRRDEERKLSDV